MKICLDAGHYGKYNRSKVVPAYYESEMNWKLVELLAKELEGRGFEIVRTRAEQGKDLGLVARGKKAKGCDLFLSIHSNAADAEYVDYPLVITMLDGKGDALGLTIAKKIRELMGTVQAGKISHKEGSDGEWYSVLWGAASVGVMGMIIEHSFHTNTKAANWLSDDSNLKKLAEAEAKIIAEYYGLSKQDKPKEESTAPETSKALEVGDTVTFTGSKHYKSSGAIIGSSCKPGKAKITAIAPGKKHPYHLVRTGSVGPYGWVNEADIAEAEQAVAWKPEEGDVVYFKGGKHYTSANAAKGSTAAAGKAKITRYVKGKKHPYHLVRTGNTGPYGWVDAGTFTKV